MNHSENPKNLKNKPTSSSDVVSTFIRKTYEMLEDQRFPDIVDWNPEGTAIVIKMPIEFGAKVLPTYFKHNNLTSFVRQLNMYNFHKRRTQKYDHVYYHDLFQKGKKHLLKEIKRKNQENSLANIQKAIEVLESVQGVQNQDATTNLYENQLLKKINKDALARISQLESKVKDLTVQNQALQSQISHQKQKEDVLVSFLADSMKKKGITLDQLPKVLNNQFNLPSLYPTFESENFLTGGLVKAENGSGCYTNFLSFGDDCSNSTEMTPSSPLSKDNERKLSTFLSEISDDNAQVKTQSQSPVSCHNEANYMNQDWQGTTLGKRNGGQIEEETYKGMGKIMKREPSQGMMNPFIWNEGVGTGNDLKMKKYESFGDMFIGAEMIPSTGCFDLLDF